MARRVTLCGATPTHSFGWIIALPLIMWQLCAASFQRIVTREDLWNGNRETFRGQFLSRDSLFLWALNSHARYRREYPGFRAQTPIELYAFAFSAKIHECAYRFAAKRHAQIGFQAS